MKKSAVEVHQMLSNTYGENVISERTCREWFQRFKNGDFDIEDRHNDGREKIFKDAELEALLHEDLYRIKQEARRIGRIIGSDSIIQNHGLENHGNDSEILCRTT